MPSIRSAVTGRAGSASNAGRTAAAKPDTIGTGGVWAQKKASAPGIHPRLPLTNSAAPGGLARPQSASASRSKGGATSGASLLHTSQNQRPQVSAPPP